MLVNFSSYSLREYPSDHDWDQFLRTCWPSAALDGFRQPQAAAVTQQFSPLFQRAQCAVQRFGLKPQLYGPFGEWQAELTPAVRGGFTAQKVFNPIAAPCRRKRSTHEH